MGTWPLFSAAKILNASGGFDGKSMGRGGMGTNLMPFFSFLMTCFFWLRRLCTGSFRRLASVTYSFHSSCAMYSFATSCHALNFSFRWLSYSDFASLSSLSHSCLYFTTSSLLIFLLLGSPSAPSCAARFSPRKIAKPDFGGCGGARFRNFSVITFMASFMNSFLIRTCVFSKPLNLSDSFHAAISCFHCSLSSASFFASAAFSSSEASANFAFSAFAPLPSPLPDGTSLLCVSLNIAKTDFGLFGISSKFTSLFSRSLVFMRSSRKTV
mmetsp:Transcript_65744/g.169191  ORF Transcript_65744/g.169191 Transcript_65744/m.169191 type:complete len:269 (-) Transcript_65744:1118-1924(-)